MRIGAHRRAGPRGLGNQFDCHPRAASCLGLGPLGGAESEVRSQVLDKPCAPQGRRELQGVVGTQRVVEEHLFSALVYLLVERNDTVLVARVETEQASEPIAPLLIEVTVTKLAVQG